MLFTGSNKCYLCHASTYAHEEVIRNECGAVCERYKRQLNKSSYVSDWGCFSESWRTNDTPVLGLDEDHSRIVF